MIEWPNNLVRDLAERQCVIFLGSGVSKNSVNKDGLHPKTWREFLQCAAKNINNEDKKKVIDARLANYDYLMACELIKTELGKARFIELLKSDFKDPGFSHAPIHEDIFSLDSPIVITPNFDSIYDSYVEYTSKNTIVAKSYNENDLIDVIRSREPFILKAHGTIKTPDEMIFTYLDYARARSEHSDFYKLLNALFITKTFLFIGAGLNDPDFKLILENDAFSFNPIVKHYFLISSDSLSVDEFKIYEESLGLNFIKYSPTEGHKELLESLHQLVSEVEDKREKLNID